MEWHLYPIHYDPHERRVPSCSMRAGTSWNYRNQEVSFSNIGNSQSTEFQGTIHGIPGFLRLSETSDALVNDTLRYHTRASKLWAELVLDTWKREEKLDPDRFAPSLILNSTTVNTAVASNTTSVSPAGNVAPTNSSRNTGIASMLHVFRGYNLSLMLTPWYLRDLDQQDPTN